MLVQLHIENFALIEKLNLQLEQGLNVLTGETGAGKSIVIDAVNLVLGGRGSTELVRTGFEQALVEAVFEVTGLTELSEKQGDLGLTIEADGTLIMSRELTKTGKNNCRINGRTVTLSMYREVGQYLIDIYGQQDHQSLLDSGKHLSLLDQLGSQTFQEWKAEHQRLFLQWRQVNQRLEELRKREKDQARQSDIAQFQLGEIDRAQLVPGEEEELLRERQVLASAEKLAALGAEAYGKLLQGSNHQAATLDILGEVVNKLREIGAIDSLATPLLEAVEGAYYQLEDAAGELRTYLEKVEFNPTRLELLEDRWALLLLLKRKYGESIAEILAYREQVAAQLEELTGSEQEFARLQTEAQTLVQAGQALAAKLSEERRKLGEDLRERIQQELADLGMPQIKFAVNYTALEQWKAHGLEDIEFLISPNRGEPLKPLARIASGGEMSRIMLAMKTILARVDQIPTLIFDEVDAGIGGRAAQAVGEKLALVAQDRQVICVTHSPQVTSLARTHFYLQKEVRQDRTVTCITKLDGAGRVQELARMLGGQSITETTLKHAAEMLQMAGTHQLKTET
ncbi:MAG: DNA repair protein RecN [Carboxydocellales bacterium]